MSWYRGLWFGLLTSCAPAVTSSSERKDTSPDASGSIELEGVDEADSEDGGDESGSDEDSEGLEGRIESGVWLLSGSTVLEDPCRWGTLLSDYWGVSLSEFLPDSFLVESFDDRFEIQATNFGAEGPIDCTVVGDDFACTLQRVSAIEVLAGWPSSWVYEIDFSGRIADDGALVGRAAVEYPQVNPGDDFNLQLAGMEHTECGQVFELTLTALDAEAVSGSYLREPVENSWHEVTVGGTEAELEWSNAAGVSWGVELRDDGLWTTEDCPYGVQELSVEMGAGGVDALWFLRERYERQ